MKSPYGHKITHITLPNRQYEFVDVDVDRRRCQRRRRGRRRRQRRRTMALSNGPLVYILLFVHTAFFSGGAPAPPGPTPGKRLRRYAYGPDRTNRCPKLTSKRHTDLKSYLPVAKIIKESDFDVKSCLAPPKSTEIDEKFKNS